MGSIRLLLGKSRWRRRRAIPREHLSGVDPAGRPTFVYVTDTQRKKAVVEQEFVAFRVARGAPAFEPDVRVLSELFETLVLRHGSGRALLSPRATALLAERVVREGAERWPWLASLAEGPAVGTALARLYGLLVECDRVSVGDVPHAAELDAAVSALRARLEALPGHIHPSDALLDLKARLASPGEGLTGWLRRTHSVVLDDVLQPTPLRTALVIALCRAWEALGVHVVIAFETGRDLGGREAGAFFGYDDVDPVAFPLRSLAATRNFRRTLFEQLVSTGEAGIHVALADAVVEVEPYTAFRAAEPPDLADAIYGPRPLPVQDAAQAAKWLEGRAPEGRGRKVRLVACADAETEIRHLAREVKQALLDGVRPGECVVALPDLDGYGPLVRATFRDHGIPHAIAAGTRLAWSPVANDVRRAASVAIEGLPADRLLALLRSDLVRTPPELHPLRLASACRAAGIRGGAPAGWREALLAQAARANEDPAWIGPALEAAERLCAPLLALALPATPPEYRARLAAALAHLGLPDRVGRCRDAPEATAGGLHAWGAVLRVLEELERDLVAVDPGTWPAEALQRQLDAALHEATFHPDPAGAERVQVVGVLELRGLTPRRTWLGGLTRGSFPAARGGGFLLPREAMRALDPVDSLAEARYLLGSLLRNALDDDRMQEVVLSWPLTREGKAVAPSPVLDDLLGLPTLVEGTLFGELVVERIDRVEGVPLSTTDALAAAASAPEAWAPLLGPVVRSRCARQREVEEDRRAARLGRWDGILQAPPPLREPMGVSTFEAFLKCPARFWYGAVLRLKAAEEWDPELAPSRKGTALHEILQRFLEERGFAPLRGVDREPAAATLHGVAVRVLDQIQAEGGAEPALLAHLRDRLLAGLVDARPRGALAAWLDAELAAESDLRPLAAEWSFSDLPLAGIQLRGKIDRLDRVGARGLLVTDYKTGKPPGPRQVRQGLTLQPLAYAAAVAERHPGEPVVSVYLSLKEPERIARAGWCGDPELVDRLVPPRGRRHALTLDEETRARLVDHVGHAVNAARGGRFHTTLARESDAGCNHCDFRRICRHDPDRLAGLDPAEVHAPLPLDEPDPEAKG